MTPVPYFVQNDTTVVLNVFRKEKGDGANLPERPEGCFAQISPVPFFVANFVNMTLRNTGGDGARGPTRSDDVGEDVEAENLSQVSYHRLRLRLLQDEHVAGSDDQVLSRVTKGTV
jgi:hypothetical protein